MDGIQYQTPDSNNNLHLEENSLPLSQQAADYLMYILSTYVLEEPWKRWCLHRMQKLKVIAGLPSPETYDWRLRKAMICWMNECCPHNILLFIVTYLSTEVPLHQAGDVSVWPLGVGPGLHLGEVRREVDRLQLVVDKLADVPGQVVVADNKVKWAEQNLSANLTEQKINKSIQYKVREFSVFLSENLNFRAISEMPVELWWAWNFDLKCLFPGIKQRWQAVQN